MTSIICHVHVPYAPLRGDALLHELVRGPLPYLAVLARHRLPLGLVPTPSLLAALALTGADLGRALEAASDRTNTAQGAARRRGDEEAWLGAEEERLALEWVAALLQVARGDVLGWLRTYAARPEVEILAAPATGAPLARLSPATTALQVGIGRATVARHVGVAAQGLWCPAGMLPLEAGFLALLETWGLGYVVAERGPRAVVPHGLLGHALTGALARLAQAAAMGQHMGRHIPGEAARLADGLLRRPGGVLVLHETRLRARGGLRLLDRLLSELEGRALIPPAAMAAPAMRRPGRLGPPWGQGPTWVGLVVEEAERRLARALRERAGDGVEPPPYLWRATLEWLAMQGGELQGLLARPQARPRACAWLADHAASFAAALAGQDLPPGLERFCAGRALTARLACA